VLAIVIGIIEVIVILVILQVEFRTRPFVNKPLRDEKKSQMLAYTYNIHT